MAYNKVCARVYREVRVVALVVGYYGFLEVYAPVERADDYVRLGAGFLNLSLHALEVVGMREGIYPARCSRLVVLYGNVGCDAARRVDAGPCLFCPESLRQY